MTLHAARHYVFVTAGRDFHRDDVPEDVVVDSEVILPDTDADSDADTDADSDADTDADSDSVSPWDIDAVTLKDLRHLSNRALSSTDEPKTKEKIHPKQRRENDPG